MSPLLHIDIAICQTFLFTWQWGHSPGGHNTCREQVPLPTCRCHQCGDLADFPPTHQNGQLCCFWSSQPSSVCTVEEPNPILRSGGQELYPCTTRIPHKLKFKHENNFNHCHPCFALKRKYMSIIIICQHWRPIRGFSSKLDRFRAATSPQKNFKRCLET